MRLLLPILEWLERAFEAHDPEMPYVGVIPVWHPLHDDPPVSEHPPPNESAVAVLCDSGSCVYHALPLSYWDHSMAMEH
jgi:hypothetical protein